MIHSLSRQSRKIVIGWLCGIRYCKLAKSTRPAYIFLTQYLIRFSLVLMLVAAGALYAQTAPDSQSIGTFSIEKVRDLSKDPKTILPGGGTTTLQKSSAKGSTNYTMVTLRIIGSLVLIIGLIYLVTWLIRKAGLAGGSARVGGGSGSMDVVEVLPLGQNRQAILFRVMDTVYLCSQTPTNIALLDKIEGQRAVELLTSTKGTSTVVHFKEAFSQFIAKMKR
jgi:flagellar biogenesis protein FliO